MSERDQDISNLKNCVLKGKNRKNIIDAEYFEKISSESNYEKCKEIFVEKKNLVDEKIYMALLAKLNKDNLHDKYFSY